ncbi:MAG: DNA mismatch repair endonuclease MutL [Acidobacteria bacterium ACB1]|nr:DNA mismatch repair protein MutL [Pyrinomonadaceae bacterium]MCE7962104.1 DNA mismatch repair endonuclease MutL [Acidobacteria bacterium ACB1]RIJ94656.1 MAG: DNA mismatch repair endonuclease MutL [Acidobacteriota bacterium]
MNKIRVLSDNLANQIAAGEVVERPASVVKELIENAIDAAATRIAIEVELGGRRLIRISDDGDGMLRDDAILAFERHATSKIRSLEDLAAIGTLGFRGEALASIASVSKTELVTKTGDDVAATRVVIEGGRLIDVKDSGRDKGTTIAIRDLFFNTPARRKFMRSEATENYHLTQIVTHYALAHPEIAFLLTNNGRETLNAPPAKDLRERAFQIFGGNLLESLLPVSGGREFVAKVSGFVSAPRERRTSRDQQYFFVNKRFVRDKTIAGGILEGYRSVLPHGVYPVAFLFIELPLDEVDVNVHPSKTEVRFRRTEAVKDAVAEAVRSALSNAGVVGEAPVVVEDTVRPHIEPQPAVAPPLPVQETMDLTPETIAVEVDFDRSLADRVLERETAEVNAGNRAEHFSESPSKLDLFERAFEEQQLASAAVVGEYASVSPTVEAARLPDLPPLNSATHLAKPADPESLSLAKIVPLGQLRESFIIAVDDEGLLLIDQHVAHERILFDKFRRSEAERQVGSQNLLLPETIDLSPAQSEAFALIEDDLAEFGFGTMRLSGRTVAIKSVPNDLPPSEARNLFAEILDTVDSEKRKAPKTTLRDDIAASLACHAAVKINMKLTPEKMRWLIDNLVVTTSPTTCPHGRPVILRLSMRDIERGFHRT